MTSLPIVPPLPDQFSLFDAFPGARVITEPKQIADVELGPESAASFTETEA